MLRQCLAVQMLFTEVSLDVELSPWDFKLLVSASCPLVLNDLSSDYLLLLLLWF